MIVIVIRTLLGIGILYGVWTETGFFTTLALTLVMLTFEIQTAIEREKAKAAKVQHDAIKETYEDMLATFERMEAMRRAGMNPTKIQEILEQRRKEECMAGADD